MNLYLSSYKLGDDKELLKSWNEKHKKVLVIPNALDFLPDNERKNNGILDKANDFVSLGYEIEILDLRKYFNKTDELNKYLSNYDTFYVLGGNVFVLRQAMKLSGFDEYLKANINNSNILYSGFSAGICVLAKDLHGIDLVDDAKQDSYGYGSTIWDGIGIIDFMPVPHYDTPNHPESHLMNDVVNYLQQNKLPYKTMHDGDTIIIKEEAKHIHL